MCARRKDQLVPLVIEMCIAVILTSLAASLIAFFYPF